MKWESPFRKRSVAELVRRLGIRWIRLGDHFMWRGNIRMVVEATITEVSSAAARCEKCHRAGSNPATPTKFNKKN